MKGLTTLCEVQYLSPLIVEEIYPFRTRGMHFV